MIIQRENLTGNATNRDLVLQKKLASKKIKHINNNRVAPYWNCLPPEAVESPTTNKFKNAIDKIGIERIKERRLK